MAKTNKEAIINLCNEINKKQGQGAIYTVDSKHANLKIDRWTTGIEDLDHILGGGAPEGRIIEIFGPESSGKTSLLYHLESMHDLSLGIPIEGTFDAERARIFGNRPKQLLIYRAKFGEDAFNKMIQFAKLGIPLIGLDSVPSMIPKEDVEKVLKAANKDSIEEQRIGGISRLMSKEIPVLVNISEITGTTVIFVNQIRDKIGSMAWGDKTDTPGGRALKFYASVRIQVVRKEWITIPNRNPYNSADRERVGLIMKCRTVKSKVSNPFQECEIPLFFDRGFVSFKDVEPIKKEIMAANRSKYGKKVKREMLEDGEEENGED